MSGNAAGDIRWIITFVLFAVLAIQDMVLMKINGKVLLAAGAAALTVNILAGWDMIRIGASCLPGVLLMVLGALTKGIGAGDIWLMFTAGQLIGGMNCLMVLLYAALLCLPVMCAFRKKRTAFVPWMLGAAYIQWLLVGIDGL